jgi:AraC-like DNA-binding protein
MRRGALPTVSIHVVRAAFAEAMARGASPAALCARFGVTAEQLADEDARVEVDVMRRIWTELPEMLGANDFGLAVARRADEAGGLHLLGYLARAAATLGDALGLLLRYQRLVQDATGTRWVEGPGTVRVVFEPRDPAFPMPRHAVEFAIASALLLTRKASGRPLAPRLVELRHARPGDDGELRRVLGCDIRYCAEAHAVTMAREDLDVPLQSADSHLATLLGRHAEALEARLADRQSFVAGVRRALAEALTGGDASLEVVARALRLSPRTLQRRLREEGTSHRRVLDDLRRDLATRYLAEPDVGIQETAFLLGFADQSAFHHAFVRWTGVAPGAYRKGAR